MPSIDDFDTGGYFSLSRFEDELTLTVKTMKMEHLPAGTFGPASDKVVLGFEEVSKKLPLNATRVDDIKDAFGKENLVGKKVVLYAAPGKGGKDTIRVREAD